MDLDLCRSLLLATVNGTCQGHPVAVVEGHAGLHKRVAQRIERFFLGNEREHDPGFFDPAFRHSNTPFRYIEMPSFYRRARKFLGAESGPRDRAVILAVSGYAPFRGGKRETLFSIRDELNACAKAGVFVYFVAPIATASPAYRSLDKIREWHAKDVIDPSARDRFRFKTLNSDQSPDTTLTTADDNGMAPRFNGEYFSRLWRYAAVITLPEHGLKTVDVIGIQPTHERNHLQSSSPLSEDDSQEFLDWFERVVLAQDERQRPAGSINEAD